MISAISVLEEAGRRKRGIGVAAHASGLGTLHAIEHYLYVLCPIVLGDHPASLDRRIRTGVPLTIRSVTSRTVR